MSTNAVTRGYLRLRSGIALTIVLFAGLVAFSISYLGQGVVVQSSENTRTIGQVMVSLAEMSLSFETIKKDPISQSSIIAQSRLRRSVRSGQEALDDMIEDKAQANYSAENQRKLHQVTLNPITEFQDIILLAQLASEENGSLQKMGRAATLGSDLSRNLLPVLVEMTEVETAGVKLAVQEQRFYVFVAVAIGLFGIYVAARYAHMPMERFIISAQSEIERNQIRAEAASESKSVFLATMSHEIRTPLNGVMGLSEVLKDSEENPERRHMLEMIVSSGRSLLQIINDVLDLSKIEAGKFEVETEVFDVKTLCKDVVELFSAKAQSKGISISLKVSPETEGWRVQGAGKAVRQSLLNLVNNAVKFTDQGSVSVALSELPASQDGQRRLQIAVSDTGIGITPTALSHIFDQFAQADSSTTSRFGGTGLGLAIVKKLCEAMDGEVTVTSDQGKGSCFVMEFPVVDCAQDVPPKQFPSQDILLGGRVLIADDNRVNLLVAQKMLTRLGCTVESAQNGQQAVDKNRTWKPDVILMDIRMPVLDGLSATRAIRSQTDGGRALVPIVGLSANAMNEHRQEGLDAGMNGYLAKPLHKAALVEELSKYLSTSTVDPQGDQEKCA